MQEMTVFQGSRSPISFKDCKDNCQILGQVLFTVSVFGEIFHLDNLPPRPKTCHMYKGIFGNFLHIVATL
jgi:hypothetical protein